jgi:hypothetical protein
LIYYYLKEKAKTITLDVLDSNGTVVRTLTSKKDEKDQKDQKEEDDDDDDPDLRDAEKAATLGVEPGVQRVVWDLRYKGAEIIPGAKIDAGKPKVGPLTVPGTYKLRFTVDGKTMALGSVDVLPDPRVRLVHGEYFEQLMFQLALRDDIDKLSGTVEQLRSLKKQLLARNELLKDVAKAKNLVEDSKKLTAKLDALEEKLHNPKAEVTYDILSQKGGAKLYSQLATLYDWSGDSDGPITQGMKEVYAEHHKELEALLADWQRIVSGNVPELNRLAISLEVPTVFVPDRREAKKP